MVTAFATADDLEARWRTLSTAEKERADVLLLDASLLVIGECPEAEDAESDVLRMIVCNIVKRAMQTEDYSGVSALQQTAGPFQQGVTFKNPSGDLYITKAERRLLPCGGQIAFTVPMLGGLEDEGS